MIDFKPVATIYTTDGNATYVADRTPDEVMADLRTATDGYIQVESPNGPIFIMAAQVVRIANP